MSAKEPDWYTRGLADGSIVDASQPKAALRKYHNEPCMVDGIKFASKKEARRYGELKLREQAKQIRWLECHPEYFLIVNGMKVGKYTGDFRYVEEATNRIVVEDVKHASTKTTAYRLRKKLMKAIHDIEIVEIE